MGLLDSIFGAVDGQGTPSAAQQQTLASPTPRAANSSFEGAQPQAPVSEVVQMIDAAIARARASGDYAHADNLELGRARYTNPQSFPSGIVPTPRMRPMDAPGAFGSLAPMIGK